MGAPITPVAERQPVTPEPHTHGCPAPGLPDAGRAR